MLAEFMKLKTAFKASHDHSAAPLGCFRTPGKVKGFILKATTNFSQAEKRKSFCKL